MENIQYEEFCQGRCPKCDSENINYGTSEPIDSLLVYNAKCDDCGCEFTEEYRTEYQVSVYNT
jgi:predicted Zn-ribbon and HTH transcriptional regulator